ncbi:hypothetical protein BTA51_08910 [Hahella sp. CCB-MM4]|uniref:DUF6586 family protein n=1 Tax=Hahella sp. (strain CCB-MM4) TaxID=1926491 RepID=UPI000B9C4534|nr:DUF6586 family protein [Hahella sp. CCB-MM4]OZG73895.1 hypothetical protein BTA51_08910 [Hahella sp. CCB-MM4]
MNWSSFINENLYFARMQLDQMSQADSKPKQIAAETAAILFLERAYYGFLNELAHKRRIKETVADIEDLESRLGIESAEVRALKLLAAEGKWLEQLLSLIQRCRQPRKEVRPEDSRVIAVSSGTGDTVDLNTLLAAMKQSFEELRETSTEW